MAIPHTKVPDFNSAAPAVRYEYRYCPAGVIISIRICSFSFFSGMYSSIKGWLQYRTVLVPGKVPPISIENLIIFVKFNLGRKEGRREVDSWAPHCMLVAASFTLLPFHFLHSDLDK